MDEATDVICALNPELDREQVQRVLQRRSQSRDGPVPQGAFVAVGRDALRGVEDHDLFKKVRGDGWCKAWVVGDRHPSPPPWVQSKDNFEVQPISEEMYSLLGSLFNTFKGAEGAPTPLAVTTPPRSPFPTLPLPADNAISVGDVKDFSAKVRGD